MGRIAMAESENRSAPPAPAAAPPSTEAIVAAIAELAHPVRVSANCLRRIATCPEADDLADMIDRHVRDLKAHLGVED